MTVAGARATDVGVLDGSSITVDRSVVAGDGAVIVAVNGERRIKLIRIAGARKSLAFGNQRYPDYDPVDRDRAVEQRRLKDCQDDARCSRLPPESDLSDVGNR
ncbi:hypothetical protein [Bosea sp. 124]|uniref:hypothetical protein n=1 Tax=Bosea sp. 124 TaxID=2135642 RepID=UPI000D38A744|nr:hypothetical protein [Bosea sp. 124]PTM41577.1 hypothetical protein C8D03_3139 [Bosea sp. 124]